MQILCVQICILYEYVTEDWCQLVYMGKNWGQLFQEW